MKAGEGSRKRKLCENMPKTSLSDNSLHSTSPLLLHTQTPCRLRTLTSQTSRWRTTHSPVIWQFTQMFHSLLPTHYTSEMTHWNASHCLPHVFLYENKCFLHGKITEGGFDEKFNIVDNSVRDKGDSEIKTLNSVCQKQRKRSRRRRRDTFDSDLDSAMSEPLQTGKLIPAFHRL